MGESPGEPSSGSSTSEPAYKRFSLNDRARLQDDGRVSVRLDKTLFRTVSVLIPNAAGPNRTSQELPPYSVEEDVENVPPPVYQPESGMGSGAAESLPYPIHLNIVIQVVGSRGDVQPFIALGNELKAAGHRVRLATHDVFDDFVTKSGLEFFPIGGDPTELMAYMVKNPGLMPSMSTLRSGEISNKRKMVATMLHGCWRSCVDPDPKTGLPFVADAIIANPPSFAHVHCAQALCIPVHIMFTMPWTSTRSFPHPLVNMSFDESSGINPGTANYVSYSVVEWLTWQGLGDVINEWRGTMNLEPVPTSEGPRLTETLKVPTTYCWSPALVPKPSDWPSHVDVCGFFFRDPPDYKPPQDLQAFLDDGPPPVYIGFGSIVIDDPEKLTSIIMQASRMSGVRAIISKGWSKLGGDRTGAFRDEHGVDVFFLGDCPHEWLFQHVSAVIHHGGAGTAACGLLNGRPTTIVPFFGDQPFWGDMVAAAGAGPKPIPQKQLNEQNLTAAIQYCLSPEAARAAADMAAKIRAENGIREAVESFHRQLNLRFGALQQCDLLPDQPAVWKFRAPKHTMGPSTLRLSKFAAEVLHQKGQLDTRKLKVLVINDIVIQNRRWDPATATTSSLLSITKGMGKGASDIVVKPVQKYKSIKEARSSTDLIGASRPEYNRPGSQKSDSKFLTATPSPKEFSDDHHSALQGMERSATASTQDRKQSGLRTTGAMVGASASGLGGFMKSMYKGTLVDLPMAAADGFRNVPKLYGEEVKEREPIRDWKSGGIVAGKTFATGLWDGVSDIWKQPMEGHRKGGAWGATKGVGKGIVGFYAKCAAAPIGLVAYSFEGVYQSMRTLNSKTAALMKERRLEEGAWLLQREREMRGDALERRVAESYTDSVEGS